MQVNLQFSVRTLKRNLLLWFQEPPVTVSLCRDAFWHTSHETRVPAAAAELWLNRVNYINRPAVHEKKLGVEPQRERLR